jgi:prepilin-type N-terminal cleavage/methylation domain-containing protein
MISVNERGFTIPELLVVIAILAIMLAGTVLFLRPVSYDNRSNDANRRVGLSAMAQALNEYRQKMGSWPAGIPAADTAITTQPNGFDLCTRLVPTFLKDVPLDPQLGLEYTGEDTAPNPSLDGCGTQGVKYTTGYSIRQSKDGAVTVSSLSSAGGRIEVTVR